MNLLEVNNICKTFWKRQKPPYALKKGPFFRSKGASMWLSSENPALEKVRCLT